MCLLWRVHAYSVYVWPHVHIHTCMCIYVCMCLWCLYLCMSVHIYVYICMWVCVCCVWGVGLELDYPSTWVNSDFPEQKRPQLEGMSSFGATGMVPVSLETGWMKSLLLCPSTPTRRHLSSVSQCSAPIPTRTELAALFSVFSRYTAHSLL